MLKGIAIMMMLWLHLFSNSSFANEATCLFWIGNTPFATIVTRACNPVSFFLVCSGYGLAYSFNAGKLTYSKQSKRIVRLYLNYWLITAIFVGVGSFTLPHLYPGDWCIVINNLTGWNVNHYNHPAWFLLPYCLLCISSPILFKIMHVLGRKKMLIISLLLSIVSMYVISRYIAPTKSYHEWYTIFITYFDLLFAFILGAFVFYYCKEHQLTSHYLYQHQTVVWVLFVVWFALHLLSGSALIGVLFLCTFVYLFIHLQIKGYLHNVLVELGDKSMVMWLIHAFIYGPFFHHFIYGCKYPILIFMALLLSSYVISIPIMWLSKRTILQLRILK